MINLTLTLSVIIGILLTLFFITPIVLLAILIIRTNKPSVNPQNSKRLDELAEIDAVIIEETNTALASILEKIQDIEERLDREDATVKGFGGKKRQQLND